MRRIGIQGIIRGKPHKTTISDKTAPCPLYKVNRQFRVPTPNKGHLRDVRSLVGLYLAGLCGIGYGLRQLLEKLKAEGIAITTIMASGGAARSPLVCQALADTTDVCVAVATTPEPVLLGSAMLASVASGRQATLTAAMREMSGPCHLFRPARGMFAELHQNRYRAFEILQAAARQIRSC